VIGGQVFYFTPHRQWMPGIYDLRFSIYDFQSAIVNSKSTIVAPALIWIHTLLKDVLQGNQV